MKSRKSAALFAALVALPMFALFVGAPAQAAPGSANSVAQCLQSGRSLSALFLLDQSKSLGRTDPSGLRYDGLKLALQSLSRVSRGDGKAVPVEVAVSAFDDGYRSVDDVVGWTRINTDNDESDTGAIDRVVNDARDRTQPAGNTDFNAAMNGAFEDMKDRGSRGACRVVFWFTDGEDGGGALTSQTCQPNVGVVDELRKQGVAVVGLQLGPPTADLEAMSTGESDLSGGSSPITCGRHPIPSDWAGGAYIQADDAAALRRLFGNLGNLVKGCAPQGKRGAVIDKGVGGMNVTIQTSSQVSTVRLDAPDGTVISAPTHGTMTESGYTVRAESDDTYASLTVDFPAGKGDGEWSVSAGQNIAADDIEYCVFSGLHLARVDKKASPAAGKPAEVLYAVLNRDNQPADLGLYKDVAVSASAVGSDGKPRKAKAQQRGDQVAMLLESEPTDLRLQVGVTAVLTTSSGLELAPLAVDEGLGMTLSGEFPTISPVEQLDLGTARNKDAASADLTLLGSPKGESQICFGAPIDVIVPDKVTGQKLDVPSGCVTLAKGETKTVQISAKTDTPAIGNGEAALPIRLLPVAGSPMAGKEVNVELPVLWRYDNPINQGVLWIVLVTILLLSVILPLATLVLVNYLTAKFTVKGLQGEIIDVTISEDGPKRVTPLANNRVLDLYSAGPVVIRNRRTFVHGDVEFRSTVPLWPWRVPTFTAHPKSSGRRIVSSIGGAAANGESAAVSPGFGFLVIVLVSDAHLNDPAVVDVPAKLIFLTRDSALSSEQLDGLMNERMDWNVITGRWREGVDVDPSGSSSSGGSDTGSRSFGHLDDFDDDDYGGGGGPMNYLDKGFNDD